MGKIKDRIGKFLAVLGFFIWITSIAMHIDLAYKKISPEEIKIIKQIDQEIDPLIDYGELTLEEVIKYIKTPEQVQDYLDKHIQYVKEPLESFRKNHEDGAGACDSFTICSAAPLKDNGYSSTYLSLNGKKESEGHSVFVYRTKKGYGCRGNTPLPAKYKSVEDLVRGLNANYGWGYKRYLLLNLDKVFPKESWIKGGKLSFNHLLLMKGAYTKIKD